MFINFGFENFEKLEVYTIEIKMGNQIQQQKLQGNGHMVMLQFMELLKQVARTDQPIRLKVSKQEEVWNQYRQELKSIENYIQFANQEYIKSFSEEFKR